jgi:hypothetical protein
MTSSKQFRLLPAGGEPRAPALHRAKISAGALMQIVGKSVTHT